MYSQFLGPFYPRISSKVCYIRKHSLSGSNLRGIFEGGNHIFFFIQKTKNSIWERNEKDRKKIVQHRTR